MILRIAMDLYRTQKQEHERLGSIFGWNLCTLSLKLDQGVESGMWKQPTREQPEVAAAALRAAVGGSSRRESSQAGEQPRREQPKGKVALPPNHCVAGGPKRP